MRIGSILHQFEQQKSRTDSPTQDCTTRCYFHSEQSQIRDKRSLNVVMHSSPYLRCTQTAIAVSSGIANAYDELRRADQPETIRRDQEGIVEDKKRQEANSASSNSAPQLSIGGPELNYKSTSPKLLSSNFKKHRIKLKLDAFLGEWLTVDYFEHMYASPNATYLLETAKIDLLRGTEDIADDSDDTICKIVIKETPPDYNTSKNRKAIATKSPSEQGFQPQDHACSENYVRNNYDKCGIKVSTIFRTEFSLENGRDRASLDCDKLSKSESTPQGIIDQARRKYVKVDGQWDSMKEPLLWGDGGELGEDWGSMHQRLNTGLHCLLNWYMNKELHNQGALEATDSLSSEEHESDTVIIIVTHGAACNALIGAFTNQPIVVEVGTSSFTMFVRKEKVSEETLRCSITSRMELPQSRSNLSNIYNLKLLASTQHLQPDINPTKIPYNPLIHSSTLCTPEDGRQTGVMETRTQGISHLSIGIPKNVDRGLFQTSDHAKLASGYMNWNSPQFDLSPKLFITGLGMWSDLAFSPKGGSLDVASDSSSEDNFLLNFADVSLSYKS